MTSKLSFFTPISYKPDDPPLDPPLKKSVIIAENQLNFFAKTKAVPIENGQFELKKRKIKPKDFLKFGACFALYPLIFLVIKANYRKKNNLIIANSPSTLSNPSPSLKESNILIQTPSTTKKNEIPSYIEILFKKAEQLNLSKQYKESIHVLIDIVGEIGIITKNIFESQILEATFDLFFKNDQLINHVNYPIPKSFNSKINLYQRFVISYLCEGEKTETEVQNLLKKPINCKKTKKEEKHLYTPHQMRSSKELIKKSTSDLVLSLEHPCSYSSTTELSTEISRFNIHNSLIETFSFIHPVEYQDETTIESSIFIKNTISKLLEEEFNKIISLEDTAVYNCLAKIMPKLNQYFLDRQEKDHLSISTVTCAIFIDQELWIVNLGNSRAITINKENLQTKQLTSDILIKEDNLDDLDCINANYPMAGNFPSHEIENDELELIRNAKKSGAFLHNNKLYYENDKSHKTGFFLDILKGIGNFPGLSSIPEIKKYTINNKDNTYLVIGDSGIWEQMTNEEACEELFYFSKLEKMSQHLVNNAIKKGSSHASCLVIQLFKANHESVEA